MRKSKKILALLLVLCLTGSLSACGNKEESAAKEASSDAVVTDKTEEKTESTPTEAPTETPEPTEELGYGGVEILKDANGDVYDLGGMEITIADWWSTGEPADPQTAQEEATEEYRQWIQDTYNFKIKELSVGDWGTHPEEFINFATSGGSENYVFVMYQSSLAAPMASGLFYDLSKLDCLDFTKDKWVDTVTQLMSKGDAVYGMRAEDPEPKFGLYFNKRMLEEAGIDPESIYDMQKDGTWTWDAFEQMCEKLTRDTDNDGVTDVYAMTNFSINFFTSCVASNNAYFVGKNDDGTYYNSTQSDEFLEAMNWGYDMIQKYEMPTPEGANWDYAYASFRNGEAAMQCAAVYEAGNMADMADDYGFVCFPKGPNATDYSNVWDDNVYVIPACYDEDTAWKIAFAFNLYSEDTPGYDGEDDWKTTYYDNYRDTRAVDESIARLKTNGVVWYDPLITGIARGDIVYGVYAGDSTPAEKVESIANQWQSYIDEANGK